MRSGSDVRAGRMKAGSHRSSRRIGRRRRIGMGKSTGTRTVTRADTGPWTGTKADIRAATGLETETVTGPNSIRHNPPLLLRPPSAHSSTATTTKTRPRPKPRPRTVIDPRSSQGQQPHPAARQAQQWAHQQRVQDRGHQQEWV